MASFSYSFCMSMLHSFWQAALLLLLYLVMERTLLNRHSPLQKRNLLYLLLSTQALLFIVSFSFYFISTNPTYAEAEFTAFASTLFTQDSMHLVTPWLFSAYIFILLYKLIKAFYTWFHFKKQYQQGLQKPCIHLKVFTQAKAHHFGIKRNIKLWFSSNISTPVTFGFLKPIILLPIALVNQISTKQAESLILHELTHIKANDYFLNWYLVIAQNLFFFNPFIAVISKKIRLEREQYCDISVIRFAYPPALYAEALLRAELIKKSVPVYQLSAVSKKHQLLKRIQFFSKEKNASAKKINVFVAPFLGLILLLVTGGVIFLGPRLSAKQSTITRIEESFKPAAKNEMPATYNSTEAVTAAALNIAELAMKNINLEALVKEVELQQPRIQKELEKLQPLIKEIQEHALEYIPVTEPVLIHPVALMEQDATKQVMVEEESTETGAASVKLYQMIFVNGKWVVEPAWMAAVKQQADSLQLKIDLLQQKMDTTIKKKLKVLREQ